MEERGDDRRNKTGSSRKWLLVAALFSLISVTFAWYNTSIRSDVNPMNMGVSTVPCLEIGQPGEDGEIRWDTSLSFAADTAALSPISGDGSHFFSANLGLSETASYTKSGEAGYRGYRKTVSSYSSLSGDALKARCLTADFYLRYDGPAEICLSERSDIRPGLDAENSSWGPGISTGLIAGALRLGLYELDEAGRETLKCIWVPHPEIELTEDPLNGSVTVDPEGAREAFYRLRTGTGLNSYRSVDTENNSRGYALSEGVPVIWEINENTPAFTSVSGGAPRAFRLRLWLEGSDRECNRALAGGSVTVSLILNLKSEGEA